jgi:hypothetical protein
MIISKFHSLYNIKYYIKSVIICYLIRQNRAKIEDFFYCEIIDFLNNYTIDTGDGLQDWHTSIGDKAYEQ